MIDFLTIILLIFGVLQIILFFKVWGMTNDVSKIQQRLEIQPKEDDAIITEAQIKTLNGETEVAFALYQKAFYIIVIELYNKTISEYGSEDEVDYESRNNYWEAQYNLIVKYYIKRVSKIGDFNLSIEKFNSYEKIHSYICKI